MPAYVETSAVLRALIERDGKLVKVIRSVADKAVTSRLTFLEVERGLSRAIRESRLNKAQQKEARRRIRELSDQVDVIALDETILERAEQVFLVEPVRSLDAIHLASMLVYEQQVGGELVVLSCDDRVRKNADAYGFDLLPAQEEAT